MSNNQYINLDKGLAIYQKDGSPFWFAYIYLKAIKKPKHVSLKTTSIVEANKLAIKKKIELETRLELGQSLNEKKFKDVLIEYHNEIFKSPHSKGEFEYTHNSITKNLNETVRRELRYITDHLIPRSADLLITNIKTHHIASLLIKEGEEDQVLANSTIAARKALFVKLFDYSKSKEYIQNNQVPEFPDIKTKIRTIRQSFSESQVEEINKIIRDMALNPVQKKASKITIENRWLLYYLFNFNLYLGSRTGQEIVENIYEDIEVQHIDGNDFFTIHVYKGKTQNYSFSRKMTISRKSESFLRELTTYTLGCSLEEAIEKHKSQKIFVRPSDGKTPNYSEQWQKVREIAVDQGVIEKEKEHLFTLYSTRHYFVSNALIKGDREDRLSLAELSKHVGTSTQLIEHTYSHFTSLQSSPKYLKLFGEGEKEEQGFIDWLLDSSDKETGEQLLKRIVPDLNNISALKAGIAYVKEYQGEDSTLEPYIEKVFNSKIDSEFRHFQALNVVLSLLLKFRKLYWPDDLEEILSQLKTFAVDVEGKNDLEGLSPEDEYALWFYYQEREEQAQLIALGYYASEHLMKDLSIKAKGTFFKRVVELYCIDDINHMRLLARNNLLAPVLDVALSYYDEMFHMLNETNLTAKAVYPLLDHFGVGYGDLDSIRKLGMHYEKYWPLLKEYLLDQQNIDDILGYFSFNEKVKKLVNE